MEITKEYEFWIDFIKALTWVIGGGFSIIVVWLLHITRVAYDNKQNQALNALSDKERSTQITEIKTMITELKLEIKELANEIHKLK